MVKRTYTFGTNIFNFTLDKQDKTNVDEVVLEIPFTDVIEQNDEIELQLENNSVFFLGLVQEIQEGGGKKIVKVWDYGSELLNKIINNVYTSMSPEAIIESVISEYSTMNYISTITTDTTYTYFANKKRAWDVVTELAELINANFFIDKDKNFRLELEGINTINTVSIDTSTAILKGKWKNDATQIYNSVFVDGDSRQVFEREPELFNGDGTTTEFILNEIPQTLKVEHPIGTILTGYTPSVSTGDYYFERESKKIIFDVAPSSGTGNIQATYDVTIPISVSRKNKESIDKYGLREKVFNKSYILTRDEAREYAEYIINRYSEPLEEATYILPTSETEKINDILPNSYIYVNDTINLKSGNYIVRKVRWENPGNFEVTVGTPSENIVFWQKEIQQKVKQLEENDDNSTILTVDEVIEENIQIKLTQSVNIYERVLPDNYLYLGDANDSPIYANIGDGTPRELRDADGGVQEEFLITDKDDWENSFILTDENEETELGLQSTGNRLLLQDGKFLITR